MDPFWEKAIGPFYDTSGLRTWLGLSRQRIAQLVQNGEILGFKSDGGTWLYPSFQFGPLGELLPRLHEVVSILIPMSEMTIMLWLNGGLADWNGWTAAELLHLGGRYPELVMAQAYKDAVSRTY